MSNRLGQKNIDMHSKLCCCLHPHVFSDSFNPQFLGENPSQKKKETYPRIWPRALPFPAQPNLLRTRPRWSAQVIMSWGLRGLPSKVQCFNSLLIKNHGYFGMGQTLVDPHFFPCPLVPPPLHHRWYQSSCLAKLMQKLHNFDWGMGMNTWWASMWWNLTGELAHQLV